MMPFSKATSPLIRTCRNKSASFVPLPSQFQTSCGCLKRVRPASGSGLMCTILQPRRFAASSVDNMRG